MLNIKTSIKKLIIASLALLILIIIYFFPKNDSYINESLSYVETLDMPIFLIDNNNYVARTTIVKDSEKQQDLVKEVIESLTINSNKSLYIPNNFRAIIPKNTKLLDLSINDNILKLNFSKEFINVNELDEQKLIEALIYSLTEINGIDKIMIFVEGEQLLFLPNSHKRLPTILDKSYGINKVYNLDSIKDTSKTTIYYLSKDNNFYYYVPVTKVSNDSTERVEIIINSLKSTPVYQPNLKSYLTASANLLSYELLENTMSLSFDNKILANLEEKSILEEVKYSIALSIRDTYNIQKVIFNVDNEVIATVSSTK